MRMKIEFGELPFWQNVRTESGKYSTMPFSLEWAEEGFIRQVSVNNNQRRIVDQYADPAYNFITTPPGSSAWGNRLGDAKLRLILDFISSLNGMDVMEIGAGSVYTAQKMLNSGASSCTIIDPAIKDVPNDPRISIIREYFSKELCQANKFDLIVSINCLEHVEDPSLLLQDVREILLRSGGKAFFSFPEVTEQLFSGDLNALLHEHINYFTKESAENMMRKNGLKILRSEIAKDSINLLLEAESECSENIFCEYMEDTYVAMPFHFQHSISRLRNEVACAARYGEKIAIHGATNGANNALFIANMGQNNNVFIFDGDKLKTGFFLPLCPNPICHTHDSKYREFYKVYVSTLTFFEEIKKTLIGEHGFREEQIVPLFSGGK